MGPGHHDDLPSIISRQPLALSRQPVAGRRPLFTCMLRMHSCGRLLRGGEMTSYATAAGPLPPQPSAGRKTGIAKLRGDSQMTPSTASVASDFDSQDAYKDKEASFLGVDNIGPANSPPIDRACAKESPRWISLVGPSVPEVCAGCGCARQTQGGCDAGCQKLPIRRGHRD